MSEKLEKRIRADLWRIRKQIKDGNESEILIWVIPNVFVCSQRPLRDHPQFGGRRPLTVEAKPLVIEWVNRIEQIGISSIICLLEDAQLERYYGSRMELHEDGLLRYYQSRGFNVRHYPLTDYKRPSQKAMEEILRFFDDLPKPVLLHCSAAIDRTTPIAAFIAEQMQDKV
jgi:protein tyrosine phosphatase (PTP) superfamily phosphohydrolase (DUF442 family)